MPHAAETGIKSHRRFDLIFALFKQRHLVVLDQLEPVCLVMQQKVALEQVYSRHLVKHQPSVLEHQQDLAQQLVCNRTTRTYFSPSVCSH